MRFLVDIIAEYKGELTYDEIHSIAKSEGIDCCRTTILNWCHEKGIFEESSYVKPALSEHHKIESIRYCLRYIKDNQEEYVDLMDNAPPHTSSRNLESLNEYCLDNGFNITFTM